MVCFLFYSHTLCRRSTCTSCVRTRCRESWSTTARYVLCVVVAVLVCCVCLVVLLLFVMMCIRQCDWEHFTWVMTVVVVVSVVMSCHLAFQFLFHRFWCCFIVDLCVYIVLLWYAQVADKCFEGELAAKRARTTAENTAGWVLQVCVVLYLRCVVMWQGQLWLICTADVLKLCDCRVWHQFMVLLWQFSRF